MSAASACCSSGASGSGKSTLLNLVCGVIAPTAGRVEVLGTDLGGLAGAARDRFRAAHFGILFQMFNLLPYLSAVDNVLLPLGFAPERRRRAGPGDGEARRLLARLGVAEVADEPAASLSVGQQQRVAAARAMIGAPPIVVADEPTSALDTDTQDAFLALLFAELDRTGASLLMVSHDRGLQGRFDRVVRLAEIARAGRPGMMLLRLAWRSLANRRMTALLTVLAVAASVALLLGVEKVRSGARDSFADTISGTDLIVGARAGDVQLLLYAVFRIGNATANVTWESYQDIAARPEVAWIVPISLGDSHKGFRVLGTNNGYFDALPPPARAAARRSRPAGRSRTCSTRWSGADVAERLGYRIGDPIVVSHGIGDVSFADHADKPFQDRGHPRQDRHAGRPHGPHLARGP